MMSTEAKETISHDRRCRTIRNALSAVTLLGDIMGRQAPPDMVDKHGEVILLDDLADDLDDLLDEAERAAMDNADIPYIPDYMRDEAEGEAFELPSPHFPNLTLE